MFDYSLPGAHPSDSAVVWSRIPLQPLAGGVSSPLSASVLTELLRRAWFAYYDRLDFKPAPLTRVVRIHKGRAYLNLSVSARLDGEHAALEPLILRLNGQPFALTQVEKPGFLAGFRIRGKRKQIEQLPATLLEELPGITEKTAAWCAKALEMRWTQAEVLQVMEEIERVGLDAMTAFLAARHNLERLYNRVLLALPGPPTARVLLLHNALSDLRDLVEVEVAHAVVEMSRRFAAEPSAAAWFDSGQARHGQEDPPGPAVERGLETFLEQFGHRGLNEGELANPRWYEDRDPVLRAIHGCIKHRCEAPSKIPAGQAARLLAEAAGPAHAEAEQALSLIRQWQTVQSRALHALAYVWTGTRRWALAAAKEAAGDGRLVDVQDVFFFELEEIKQMMTGEWNISDLERIHAVCARRKAEHAHWQATEAGELLIDDREAGPPAPGLGVVGGRTTGPLHHWRETRKNGRCDAIAAAQSLDSGWSVVLPIVHGAVSAGGGAADPFVAAARVWHRPTVIALGPAYDRLVEGAQTTVDGDHAVVEQ